MTRAAEMRSEYRSGLRKLGAEIATARKSFGKRETLGAEIAAARKKLWKTQKSRGSSAEKGWEMKEILTATLRENGIAAGESEIESLIRYWNAVKEKNKVMNLTAVTDDADAAVKHFADCLKGAEYLRGFRRVLDLGSGAGFPGIPLAIMLPDTQFLLMDSLMKRIGFLNEVISELGLKNVTTLHARAEDAAKTSLRESFDGLTARAVAPLRTLLEYALPFLKTGGKAFFYKGQDFAEEESAAETALRELKGKILKNHEFLLNNGLFRVIIEVVKSGKTPEKYPRGQNKPKTNPIG